MVFPLANALYFQGTTFVANATLGAASVVAFNSCRIFSRCAPLVLLIVRQTLWMEYPHLYAKHQMLKLRLLQRMASGLAWLALIAGLAIAAPLGPRIIHWWTLGKVLPQTLVVCLFLLVGGCNSYWNTTSTIMLALNKHESLAKRYLVWVLVALAASYLLAPQAGLLGIGCALLIVELPLCWHAVVVSCRLGHDRIADFVWDTIILRSLRAYLAQLAGARFARRRLPIVSAS